MSVFCSVSVRLILAGALVALPGLAVAQGGPIRIGPPQPGDSTQQPILRAPAPARTLPPVEAAPANPAGSTAPLPPAAPPVAPAAAPAPPTNPGQIAPVPVVVPQSPAPPRVPAASTIEQIPLGPLDFDRLGVSAGPRDPFGEALWRGTSRTVAASLVRRLPEVPGSTVLVDLQRRLLAAAAVPDGPAADGVRLLPHRLPRLAALGDDAALTAILGGLPQRQDGDALLLIRLERAFAAAPNDGCAAALSLLETQRAPTWLPLRAACAAISGDTRQAQLMVTAAQERGTADPLVAALVEGLAGARGVPLDPPERLFGWHVALAQRANRELPLPALAVATPAVARLIARDASQPASLRAAAAERAARVGALTPADLATVLTGLDLPPAEPGQIAQPQRGDPGPRARAQLFRTASARDAAPTLRWDAARGLLAAARPAGLATVYARALRPALDALPPAAAQGATAADATRLLALGGSTALAAWAEIGTPVHHWAILRLAGRSDGVLEHQMLAWLDAERRARPDALPSRAALLVHLMQALGDEVPAAAWVALVDAASPTAPAPAALSIAQLRGAAGTNRVGEAVALALVSAGTTPPGEITPLLAGELVNALRAVGLEEAARALAVEIAVLAGL
ncbi:MAG: hypothetical protein SF002_05590 [Alphaproteobacteria bacterium]|nr:hypothetical protein [Alphaproteobacteria bacterium]